MYPHQKKAYPTSGLPPPEGYPHQKANPVSRSGVLRVGQDSLGEGSWRGTRPLTDGRRRGVAVSWTEEEGGGRDLRCGGGGHRREGLLSHRRRKRNSECRRRRTSDRLMGLAIALTCSASVGGVRSNPSSPLQLKTRCNYTHTLHTHWRRQVRPIIDLQLRTKKNI